MEGFGRVALLNDIRAVVVVKTLVALVVAVMNVEAREKRGDKS